MSFPDRPSQSPSQVPSDTRPFDTVPVTEEHVSIGKRTQDVGGVRVRIEVDEVPHESAVESVREHVTLERVPVGRQVSDTQAPWLDGDVLVVPVYEEVAVVERRLVLKEEIRMRRHRVRATSVEQVSLRRERAIVERQSPDGEWRRVDMEPGTDSIDP